MKIRIAEYDAAWPALFHEEEVRIRAALGECALMIEHAGSTSVPGLAAKPVIDIVLVVQSSAYENAYLAALENGGYVLRIREPEWHEHRMFNRPGVAVNLHVFSRGCPEIGRVIQFRDWLRGNAVDRELYARTKLDLARREWDSIDDYANAKTQVIAEIFRRAYL